MTEVATTLTATPVIAATLALIIGLIAAVAWDDLKAPFLRTQG